MTKIYKINGKEIKGFNISKDILGEFAPEHKIDELLEALSDKEEPKEGETEEGVKVFNKCRRCYHEAYGKEYPYAHTCQPKQSCNYLGGEMCKTCIPTHSKPKQEECLHLKQKILHKLDGSTEETCRDCGKDIGGSKQEIYSKQSTGLKENAAGIIYEYLRASGIIFNTIDSKEMASKILKLLQSYLVKEIEEDFYGKILVHNGKDPDGVLSASQKTKQDIIKIINNISK